MSANESTAELIAALDHKNCNGTVAVIAIGNELRGDDGIGPRLLYSVAKFVKAQCCLFDLGPITGLLARAVKGHKAAIIIDATASQLEPGEALVVPLEKAAETAVLRSSHGISLLDELIIAKQSGEMIPAVYLFGIQPGSVEFGQALSDKVQRRIPFLTDALRQLIETLAEQPNNA